MLRPPARAQGAKRAGGGGWVPVPAHGEVPAWEPRPGQVVTSTDRCAELTRGAPACFAGLPAACCGSGACPSLLASQTSLGIVFKCEPLSVGLEWGLEAGFLITGQELEGCWSGDHTE